MHLDVKANNILINFNKHNQFLPECAMLPIEFKLADFGIAKNLNDYPKGSSQVFRSGTPKYMAPEQFVISNQKHDPFKCETFSLGVTLFHLIFKVFPFSPNSFEDRSSRDPMFVENFVKSSRNQYKVEPSRPLVKLLQGMLNYNSSDRFSMNDVLRSEYFAEQYQVLRSDQIVRDRTRKNMFSKLQYVMNLTKVKLNVPNLKNKMTNEAISKEEQIVAQ